MTYINCKTMRQVSIGNPDITTKYFRDIRRLKQLSAEEQTELIKRYAKAKDKTEKEKIRNQLLMSNQAFIVSMARHLSVEDDFNDLISEGNLGMIKAIEKFDIDKDNTFLTYATYHIKKAMVDYMASTKKMVKPRNISWVYAYSDAAKNKFFLENGRYPSPEEVKEEVEKNGVTISNKEDLYDITFTSIDTLNSDGMNANTDVSENDTMWIDTVSYDGKSSKYGISNVTEHIEHMTTKQIIERSLNLLDYKERKIVKEYYGIDCEPLTQYEIALELGVDPEKADISKIVNSYIKKIRKNGKIETYF